jgi:Ni/Co efflux regulator RcnB
MMKTAKHKLAIALGLSACLALPGLAMADGGKRSSYRDHDRIEYRSEARQHHDRHRYNRWERHERKFERWQRHEAREWRRHAYRDYHGYRVPVYYRQPARGGIYLSGVYFTPNPHLIIDLH